MKKEILLFFVVVLPFLYTGCEKTDDGSYTDPITLYEKLPGTWSLNSMKLVDEIAKAASIEPGEMDIRVPFGFTSYTITFHVDSSFKPAAYEVVSDAPALFAETGYWDLENPFTNTDGSPSLLNLYSDASRLHLTDQLRVTTLPGTRRELEFRLTRYDGGTPYVTYIYRFRYTE